MVLFLCADYTFPEFFPNIGISFLDMNCFGSKVVRNLVHVYTALSVRKSVFITQYLIDLDKKSMLRHFRLSFCVIIYKIHYLISSYKINTHYR